MTALPGSGERCSAPAELLDWLLAEFSRQAVEGSLQVPAWTEYRASLGEASLPQQAFFMWLLPDSDKVRMPGLQGSLSYLFPFIYETDHQFLPDRDYAPSLACPSPSEADAEIPEPFPASTAGRRPPLSWLAIAPNRLARLPPPPGPTPGPATRWRIPCSPTTPALPAAGPHLVPHYPGSQPQHARKA